MKYNTDFLSSETNPAVTSCFADTVSRPVPHASSLSASGFLALWLCRRSSSPAPSAFLSSSAIGCGLLPLFSPKSLILSRAICFLSFLYGLAEVCTVWGSRSPESLFAARPNGKFFIRFLLGLPCWGEPVASPPSWASAAWLRCSASTAILYLLPGQAEGPCQGLQKPSPVLPLLCIFG